MTKRPTLFLFGLLFLLASGWFLLNLTRMPLSLVNPLSDAQIEAAVEEVTGDTRPEITRPLTDELIQELESQTQIDGETVRPSNPTDATSSNGFDRLNLTLSAVSLFITAVGFVFTAVFTIRQDRRDAVRYRLEVEKLQRQIVQLKQQATPAQPQEG